MPPKKANSKYAKRALRVGDKVWIRLAGSRRMGRIVEDRGGIGRGGRRLLRVAYSTPSGRTSEGFELPAENVTSAEQTHNGSRKTKTKAHA